jgi:hypothetical protein
MSLLLNLTWYPLFSWEMKIFWSAWSCVVSVWPLLREISTQHLIIWSLRGFQHPFDTLEESSRDDDATTTMQFSHWAEPPWSRNFNDLHWMARNRFGEVPRRFLIVNQLWHWIDIINHNHNHNHKKVQNVPRPEEITIPAIIETLNSSSFPQSADVQPSETSHFVQVDLSWASKRKRGKGSICPKEVCCILWVHSPVRTVWSVKEETRQFWRTNWRNSWTPADRQTDRQTDRFAWNSPKGG